MLDKYKDTQKQFYDLIYNSVKNNRISHAYLIDSNGCSDSFDIALSLVKTIVCPYNYTNFSDCGECNICKRIDDGNYLELKVISPDGKNIKKEQLLELQEDFSKTAIENSKRIYIIRDCEKLNVSSSNCILKFLEEPSENIYAILLTNDINKILSTIISRCQIIQLTNVISKDITTFEYIGNIISSSSKEYIDFIGNEENKKLLEKVISFVDFYEEKGLDVIIYMQEKWFNYVKERSDILVALKIILYFYYEILRYKIKKELIYFKEYQEIIDKISEKNSENNINNKINILLEKMSVIDNNLNLNLVMDDLIIQMESDSSASCWN